MTARVARLDQNSRWHSGAETRSDGVLSVLVGELLDFAETGRAADTIRPMTAAEATGITADSRLLEQIRQKFPEVCSGRTMHPQVWTATSRSRVGRPSQRGEPEKRHFDDIDTASAVPVAVKPFGLGMYTSTLLPTASSMWLTYLSLVEWGDLFPKPWTSWLLMPAVDARVYRVATVSDWVDIVESANVAEGPFLYPDWKSIGRAWDAIHFSAVALAAMNGFPLETPRGVIAPGSWDVECTFWLRWKFAVVSEVPSSGEGVS